LEDVPLRELKEDEVLIKVYSCGICQTDVDEFMAGPKFFNPVPLIPGHEFGGWVEEVGSSVDESLKGKVVTVSPLVACGKCEFCRAGRENLCKEMQYHGVIKANGGFAEYAIVKASNVIEVEDIELVHFGELCLVALRMLKEAKRHCPWGKEVLVVGAGPLGLCCAELFRSEGWSVEMCEVREKRRNFAYKRGFKTYETMQSVPNNAYDVVLDCAGEDPVIPYAFSEEVYKVKKAGAIILGGLYFSDVNLNLIELLGKEIVLFPIFTYTYEELKSLKKALNSVKELVKKITCRVPFENLVEALLELETKKEDYLKVALKHAN